LLRAIISRRKYQQVATCSYRMPTDDTTEGTQRTV